MQKDVPAERLARLKRRVPKGMIKVAPMPPLKGEVLQPVSFSDLGLRERKAA